MAASSSFSFRCGPSSSALPSLRSLSEDEEDELDEESLTTDTSRIFLSLDPLCFPRFRLLPALCLPLDRGVARRGEACQSASFWPRGVDPGDTFRGPPACGGVAPENSRSGVSTVLGSAIAPQFVL